MNPMMIQLFRSALPYAVVFGLGFCAAWYVQGLRVQSAKQELVAHQQAATMQRQQEKDRTDKLQEDIANDWNENLVALRKYYDARSVRTQPGGMPSGGLSAPTKRTDGTSDDDLPTPARIVRDCAEETLKLIHLQRWNAAVAK